MPRPRVRARRAFSFFPSGVFGLLLAAVFWLLPATAGAESGCAESGVFAVNNRFPDFDQDGDVDLTDFSGFQACFNGPNVAPSLFCAVPADLDFDGDVDLQDFATFQACFNGPNRPPACE